MTTPALVLGSTQPRELVDAARAAAAGVEVVRRRSGGGVVLLRPGQVVWVDVFVPAGDPLWEPDVSRAFHWLGQVWVEALAALGTGARWHDGPTVPSRWSRRVCFAGLGPGEVTIAVAGTGGPRKVVGISQRRRRAGSLFQCAALLAWDPPDLLGLLRVDDDERRRGAAELHPAAAGLGLDGRRLADAFLERLAGR